MIMKLGEVLDGLMKQFAAAWNAEATGKTARNI